MTDRPHHESPQDRYRRYSIESAHALAALINAQPGAPRARAWIPSREGESPRVYVGTVGYLSTAGIDLVGTTASPGSRGQYVTFHRGSLYPSQKPAMRAALTAYRETYAPAASERMMRDAQREAEHVYALVLGVIEAAERGTTIRAICAATGLPPLDVLDAVRGLAASGDVLARNLGTEREKIIA